MVVDLFVYMFYDVNFLMLILYLEEFVCRDLYVVELEEYVSFIFFNIFCQCGLFLLLVLFDELMWVIFIFICKKV